MNELHERVAAEVRKLVLGADEFVGWLIAALACRGHVLLEGVPGTAKTLLATTVARSLDLESARVQFTPDLLPSDITGTMTLREGELSFRRGPVFTNVLIADEINRTPPKTQAALLEAMQERQVSVEGAPRPLPDPFLTIATQNPIEYEGTYPLPEAQLDRFMVKLDVGYPSEDDERALLGLEHEGVSPGNLDAVETVGSAVDIAAVREQLDATSVSDDVMGYAARLVRRTRELPSVSLGASPRAGVHLLAAARALARLAGRDYVVPDDVAAAAQPVLAHRLLLTPDAELARYRPVDAIGAALEDVEVPR